MILQNEEVTSLVSRDLSDSMRLIEDLLPDELKAYIEHCPYLIPRELFPLRPLLLLLSARRYGAEGVRPVRLSAAVQMIHYASLLHDRLGERRLSLPSDANAEDKDRMEAMDILLGDLFFAKASSLIIEHGDRTIIEDMIQTSIDSAETQARIISFDRYGRIEDPEEYFSALSDKLSLLFALSCRVGALIGGAPEEERNTLSTYGLSLGRVVRIAEDVRFWKGPSRDPDMWTIDPLLTYPMLLLRKQQGNERLHIEWPNNGKSHAGVQSLREVLISRGYLDRSLETAGKYAREAGRHLESIPFSEEVPVFMAIATRWVGEEGYP